MPDLPPPPPAFVRPASVPGPLVADLVAMPRTRVVAANGLRFTCRVWGPATGPLVLCLHGFPESATGWDRLGPVLARAGYRVVAPWMRGYHPTEAPKDDDYGPRALGEDALALMTAFDAPRATVIGHDWGAGAAIAAAQLAPHRVDRLITVAIPHPAVVPSSALLRAHHFLTLPLPGAVGRLAEDDYAEVEAILRRWSPNWRPSAAEVEEAKRAFRHPGGARAILGYYRAAMRDALGAPDARAFTRSPVRVPTLAISGGADAALDPALYDLNPPMFPAGYDRAIVVDAGHFPQREAPEAFNAAVLRFLGVPR